MNFRLSKKLLIASFLLVVGLVLAATETGIGWLGYISIPVLLLGVVQAGIFCRCPACGAPLLRRTLSLPDTCPECGVSLKDTDQG